MKNKIGTMIASAVCIALLASCAAIKNTVSPIPGTYQNNMAEADTTGKTIALNLFADKACNLQMTKKQGGTKTETGTWASRGTEVTVTLIDPANPAATKTLVFEKRMEEMVNKEWDKNIYGASGLGMLKKR